MGRSVTMFVRNDLRNDARVWKEARTLQEAGWRVRLIGVQGYATAAREAVAGIEVARVSLRPLDSRLLRRGAGRGAPTGFPGGTEKKQSLKRRVIQAAKRRYAPVHELLNDLEFSKQAFACAAENPSDVYHAHDLNAFAPAAQARKAFGGKLILDHHEFFSERNFYRQPGLLEHAWLREREREAARAADLNITVSHGIAQELKLRYTLAKLPQVIMNCPEPPAGFTVAEPLAVRLGGGPVLLYIGLATWNRGLEQVVEALQSKPDWRLAILGPVQGGYRSALESHAGARGVAKRVHFLDPVPPAEVSRLAAGADVAVLMIQNACLSYYLCSPNKLFEALAAGLPVAASDFPDLRRVLAGTGVGSLCENPASPAAVANAIEAALALPRDAVREKAASIAAEYTWEKEGAKLLAAYEKLLPKKVVYS